MRSDDFNLENMMDHMEYKRLDVHQALESAYPGMVYDDLTEDEEEEFQMEMDSCNECCTPMRRGNLEWSDCLRADVCYDCLLENECDDE